MLENSSSKTLFETLESSSNFRDHSQESIATELKADSVPINSFFVAGSPSEAIGCGTPTALVSQSRNNASEFIDVHLDRSSSGFGITLAQRGPDVIVSAVATGSPSHRYQFQTSCSGTICDFSINHVCSLYSSRVDTQIRSGLLRGDVLLTLNSSSVHDFLDMSELLAYFKSQVHQTDCLCNLFLIIQYAVVSIVNFSAGCTMSNHFVSSSIKVT
jgi:hypothetical protein